MPFDVEVLQFARQPAATDDSSALTVHIGSLWRDTVTGDLFICTNASNDAAVWKRIGSVAMSNEQATGTTLAPTVAQSNTRFIVSNVASVTVTLPAIQSGLAYEFVRSSNAEMVVASTEGSNMIVGGSQTASSVTCPAAGQQLGTVVRVEAILVSSTLKWLVTMPVVQYTLASMLSVQAAATTLAPSAAQSGSRFVVTNVAAVAVTLPAVAAGLVYEFLRAADEEMVISSAAGDDMIVGHDVSADSVTFTTAGQQIGAVVRVEGVLVGTTPKWLVTLPLVPFGTGVTGHFAHAIGT